MGIGGFVLFSAVGFLVSQILFSRMKKMEEEQERSHHDLRNRLIELERQLRQLSQGQGSQARGDLNAKPSPSVSMAQSPPPPPAEGSDISQPSQPFRAQPPASKPAFVKAPHEPEVGVEEKTVPSWEPRAAFGTYVEPASEPDPISIGFQKVKTYLTTGNTIAKVGVLLIFFGVSFLLKYAIDNNMLPIELRLIAVAVAALALVKTGWSLRDKSRDYGLLLQGGGIGLLFLTTFVSFKTYALIPSAAAFFLLVAFTMATAMLAVKQDSLNLAAFGLCGGFLAPILASSGQGQHVILFSYYALLNLGVVFISWEKTWRELNLLGFVFTFAISTGWGVLKYNPELYATTQPFLILFFLMYIAIPLIFANKKEPELRGYVDGTIVFGNSAITLMLQLQLVKNIEYAGAFSALGFAAFYIFLSTWLLKHKKDNFRLLSEAFISIGIVFVTIAIPLAFDGLKTSAVWALEAAGIYWVAVHQNRTQARLFSTLLLFGTSVSFFLGPARGSSDLIFLNTFFLSCLFMACGAYVVSYLSGKYAAKLFSFEAYIPELSFAMGTLWWVYGGLYEIDRFTFPWWSTPGDAAPEIIIPYIYLLSAQLLYLTSGALAVYAAGKSLSWSKAKLLAQAFVVVLLVAFLRGLARHAHSFEGYGALAWAAALLAYYFILHNSEKDGSDQQGFFVRLGHAGALWVLVGVLVREAHWLGLTYVAENSSWGIAAMALAPAFSLWLVAQAPRLLPWPVQRHRGLYLGLGAGPVAVTSLFWLLYTTFNHDGVAAPLPYVPFLNPLELSQLVLLFSIILWARRALENDPELAREQKVPVAAILGATTFFWLNGVLCRAIHHFAGVPFRFDSLFESVIVQVSLSLFWTLLGIAVMLFASKKGFRWLWLTGAGLLGVVVAKMFLIDLSKTETIARVISFIGVGVLFLVVGYFSPIPPKRGEKNA